MEESRFSKLWGGPGVGLKIEIWGRSMVICVKNWNFNSFSWPTKVFVQNSWPSLISSDQNINIHRRTSKIFPFIASGYHLDDGESLIQQYLKKIIEFGLQSLSSHVGILLEKFFVLSIDSWCQPKFQEKKVLEKI